MSQAHASTLRLAACSALALATWSTLNWHALAPFRCSILDGALAGDIRVTRNGDSAPGVSWCRATDGTGPDVPLVTGDLVIVERHDSLVALDSRSGRARWSRRVSGREGIRPLGHAGRIVVASGGDPSDGGSIEALSPVDGRTEWRVSLPHGAFTGMELAGGRLVVGQRRTAGGEERTTVTTLDATSGEVRWRHELTEPAVTVLAAAEPSVLLVRYGTSAEGEHEVLALDPSTGRLLWSDSLAEHAVLMPVVAGPVLVTADRRGDVRALDRATGRLAWTLSTGEGRASPHGVGDGLYLVTADFRVLSVNPLTGTIRWGTRSRHVRPRVWEADGLTFVSGDGAVRALDAGTGEERWYRPLPVTADRPLDVFSRDDRLYVVSGQDGLMLALDPSTGHLRGSVDAGLPVRWMAPIGTLTFVAGWDDVLYALAGF